MDLRNNKPLLAGVAAIILAVAAWLAFGFFGIQAAFIDDEVNETGPVFASSGDDQGDAATTDEATDEPSEPEDGTADVDEAADDSATTDEGDSDESVDTNADTSSQSDSDSSDSSSDGGTGEVVTVASGDFSGVSRYEVAGQAVVLNDGSEQRFLRFEQFEADNGPDLKVYLRADNGDFVNLGELKGNIGDQNYEIPTDVDLSVFDTVEIWCERFSVGFGEATLVTA